MAQSQESMEDRQLYDRCAEALAEYAHNAWAAYMGYFLKNLAVDAKDNLIIPAAYVTALRRQIMTPYHTLSYEEQLADQEEAEKILDILKKILM